MVPKDLQYSEQHEWIRVEDGTAIVGITDYAQKELGDIVFVELPPVGEQLTQAEPFSEIYAPVSGEVMEVNEKLDDTPQIINLEPYGEGWMIKIKLDNEKELEDLLSAEEYGQLIGE
jgi:glycine cleavage system H protein